jgi:hypothetical protein
MPRTLHDDLSMFYCCRPHKVAIKACRLAVLRYSIVGTNDRTGALQSGGNESAFARKRHNITFNVHCPSCSNVVSGVYI